MDNTKPKINLLFTARSCGAYLFEMNETKKQINDSTDLYLFEYGEGDFHFLSLTDSSYNLYMLPITANVLVVKIAEFMYIICNGNRYVGIAFPTFVIYVIFFTSQFFYCLQIAPHPNIYSINGSSSFIHIRSF